MIPMPIMGVFTYYVHGKELMVKMVFLSGMVKGLLVAM